MPFAAHSAPVSAFSLHPRLAADTVPVGRLALSHVALVNDARFPWLLLVPARPGLCEIHDLAEADRARLMEEIAACSRALSRLYGPGKINVGALGIIVGQLHVHVVMRHEGDAAWPGPVWGAGDPDPYGAEALARRLDELRGAILGLDQAK